MTKRQEQREIAYRDFTYFGASRFAFYVVSGIALILGLLNVAGWCMIIGAAIGAARRLVELSKHV